MYIIWQGKASYSAVKRSLYAEILYTTGDDGSFFCTHKNSHQQSCKNADNSGNNYTENKTEQEGLLCSFEDTIFFTGTVVLCNKNRVSITEILHRKIGKGVNLDGSRSRHLRSTYNVMPIPETYCVMTVANAAPQMLMYTILKYQQI